MRMALCWPSLLLLLFASTAQASTINYTLTSEITNFVPPCAQECFVSFLDVNIPTSACSTTPTLACLCSHNSTSGYTVGEGALQCIISEIEIGFCQGEDADESVAISAFHMCDGEADALPNTHGTITATLIIQSSSPSVVLVAPIATATSISISTTIASSTRKTLTSSIRSSSSSSTLLTTSLSSTQSSISPSTTLAQAVSQTEAPTHVLSKPQVVGISVASVAGGVLLIGALILFCCLRRRRKQRELRDSDLLPFQLDPPAHLMDKKKYKYSFRGPLERKPGGTANGVAARVRPQVPPRLDTSSPNMFSRRSIKTDTIGLAISPESNVAVEKQQRRSSKLLPEKPSLTVMVPPSQRGAGLSFSVPMGATVRQSTATHFEEDEVDSADTAVDADDSWGRKSTEGILDASMGNGPTIRVVNRDPATSTSGGDAYPHWRPQVPIQASQAPQKPILAAPDYYIPPLNVSRVVSNFSQPRKTETLLQPPAKPLQLTIPNSNFNRPLTGSSSIYSARGSLPSSAGRHSAPRPHKSYRQSGPYDTRQSSGSLTSFDSGTSGFSPIDMDREVEPRTATVGGLDLSPVVESPVSGGVSPVVYPRIPGRLSGTVTLMPPPPQPVFTRTGAPTMQAEPLSNARVPQPVNGVASWRQAEINAQRERERVMRLQDQARIAARELQIQVGVGMQNIPSALQVGNGGGHWRNGSGSGAHPLYIFPTSAVIPRSQTAPSAPIPRSQTAPPLVDATGGFGHGSRVGVGVQEVRSESAQSQHSQASKASTSSSLLAKRVGEVRAKGLVLRNGEEDARRWRVLGSDDIEKAKGQGWRPMVGASGSGVSTEQRGGNGNQGGGKSYERMETPVTPGWMPTLTPTRRGDDLFLSVR